MNHQIQTPDMNAWLLRELGDVKKLLAELKENPEITTAWLPRARVMAFFDYGDTQMASLEKSGRLVVSKVGNRKFIHRDSLLKLLEDNAKVD